MLVLSACALFEEEIKPPPRAHDPIEVPQGASKATADITIPLDPVRQALERELPRQLWSISEAGAECVPSKRTQVIGITLRSPMVRCDLDGSVSRGAIRLSGRGRDLIVTMPIRAEITASDIAGVIARETATASATVTARVRLLVQADWSVRSDVKIRYDWREPPSVEVLGQKIRFADQTDRRLTSVVATLEKTLEAQIARLDLRSRIAPVWESGFTVLALNAKNPSVWLRLTPEALGYDGYKASRGVITMTMRLDAGTEIFVGDAPKAPVAAPLPLMTPNADVPRKVTLTLPVVAQYDQLETVLMEALSKRSQRPFVVPVIGDRMIAVKSVTAYSTTGNRLAVGVEFTAWPPGEPDDAASGTVWLIATPQNASNSRMVQFVEPEYIAQTSRLTSKALLEIAKVQDFSKTIEDALTQNFEDDFEQLLGKVDRAVAQQQLGDFVISTTIDNVSTGTLTAYGEGLFLGVTAQGNTQIRYAPQ